VGNYYLIDIDMHQELAVNKVLMDMMKQHIIVEGKEPEAKIFLYALWGAGWDEKGKQHGDRRSREIQQFTIEGDHLNTFHNTVEAAKELKCARKTIRIALQTGEPTDRRHLWKYADNGDNKHIKAEVNG
jgi:NUMOD1 domain